MSQSQLLAAQNTTPVALLPQVRSFQTTAVTRDIDSAAKFIGAGAATVGVAGSGTFLPCASILTTSHVLNSCYRFIFLLQMNRKKMILLTDERGWQQMRVGYYDCSRKFDFVRCSVCNFGLVENLHLGHTYEYLVTQSLRLGKVWEKVISALFLENKTFQQDAFVIRRHGDKKFCMRRNNVPVLALISRVISNFSAMCKLKFQVKFRTQFRLIFH